jgi:hypothetical protein
LGKNTPWLDTSKEDLEVRLEVQAVTRLWSAVPGQVEEEGLCVVEPMNQQQGRDEGSDE